MLNWLVTVPVTNKVDRKLKNYQIGSASFDMENQLQINRSFSDYFLPLVNRFPLFLFSNSAIATFVDQVKHLIVRPNIQYDHQQLYQFQRHLARRIYGLTTHSTDWLQYRWRIRLTENWIITKVVWPPSLCQKNIKTNGHSVLTSYLL